MAADSDSVMRCKGDIRCVETPALGGEAGMKHLAGIEQHGTQNTRKPAAGGDPIRRIDRGVPFAAAVRATPGRVHIRIVRPTCDAHGRMASFESVRPSIRRTGMRPSSGRPR